MKTVKLAAFAAAAAVFFSAAVTAASARSDEPSGYVVFSADKAVLGQGFVVEPVLVPFYEGENGIAVVKRAADAVITQSDYGDYVSGFADTDTKAALPAVIAEVFPEMTGRVEEGYLCAYDYTPVSGWNYFVNGESAMVGISDYLPEDGDVLRFSFTVYGFGADLGIDNSSWGGEAALVPMTDGTELMRLCVYNADKLKNICPGDYDRALSLLSSIETTQDQLDEAFAELNKALSGAEADDHQADEGGKPSPDTGVGGAAVFIGAAALAAVGLCVSRHKG